MIQETEDDRLDQSLRDTFSDFNLPPSKHVWRGIEGRLPGLPGTPRPVPLRLLLPVVGLVGVTIGWLLPRPAPLPPVPQPTPTIQAQASPAGSRSPLPVDAAVAYSAPRLSANGQALRNGPKLTTSQALTHNEQFVAASLVRSGKRYEVSRRQGPVEPVAGVSAAVVEVAGLGGMPLAATLPLNQSVDIEAVASSMLPLAATTNSLLRDVAGVTTHPAHTKYAAELPKQHPKGENLQEWRPEYRIPTHRLAERGRGLRRIRNSISRRWESLLGPRRNRSGQLSF